ncbi:hypothetical protein LBMAG53_12550 [Planctomycetota bacterium]|nr:hypothetical protein LBMAG53_12550 [Planctomycetota bacterium]
MRAWGFHGLFGLSAVALVTLVLAAFVLPAPWSWGVGLAYIAYDTWLLVFHLVRSRRAVINEISSPPPNRSGPLPSLTVVVAAFNERAVLPGCLDALRTAGAERVVVVDDGSTDGTSEVLAQIHRLTWEPLALADNASDVALADGLSFGQSPDGWLTVIRQPRCGKARALNRALRRISSDLVVTIDADTVLVPGGITAFAEAFARDPALTAACGVLEPVCSPGPLAGAFAFFQRREYARAFLWRCGWAAEGSLVLISGACAAYRRQALIAAGGYDRGSLVEDYEVMYRLNAAQPGQQAAVIRQALATTDAPGSPGRFLRQRGRWFAGFIATLWRYRSMVGDPRQGALGLVHLRIKTIDLLLPLYGLAAGLALVVVLVRDGGLHPGVLAALAAKAVIDASLHAWAETWYQRWLGRRPRVRSVALAIVASLAEQVFFQPLRQLGAACGWWRHLISLRFGPDKGWQPARKVPSSLPPTGASS